MIFKNSDGVEKAQRPEAVKFSSDFLLAEDGEGTLDVAVSGALAASAPATASETFTTGTVTLSTTGVTVLNATGAITGTLGSGSYIGQIKVITMQTNATSSTVSITNHQTSDPEVATFDAVDETGVFMWTGTEWITIFATCTFV
jgi:ribosomal protein S3